MPRADPPVLDRDGRPTAALNASQQRNVRNGVVELHRRMVELEAMLTEGANPSPFSQYVSDLSPTEIQIVRDYFARLRARMLACLQETGIPLDVRRTSVRWGLQVGMTFLHIAVAEFGPGQLRGYGPLDAPAAAAVENVQRELWRLIDRLGAYLRQGLGRDLAERLARLEATSAGAATLAAVDRVVTRRGLVEFRPQIDQLTQRLTAPQFEIAFFGRVSSGKSSLLNHLAGRGVLPVGVTPITAVPTRLARGDEPAAVISFAETEPRAVPVEQLREYASEEGNLGNAKHVTGILVRLPAPRLREGVVLVDTPGVGSLARSGSAETFAYLPNCDLGVVLIDAASALTPDDLELVRLLYEAATPAQVVISKADLLTPADRERTVGYVREQLRRELGLDLEVHAVSTVGADEALLTRWFEEQIEPLLARHQALAEASLRRKVAHLCESVLAVLETLRARNLPGAPGGRAGPDPRAVRRLLDEADAAAWQAEVRCRGWAGDEPALLEILLRDAARAVVAPGSGSGAAAALRVLADRGQMAHEVVAGLQRTLARTLGALQQALPLGRLEGVSVRDLRLGGLPAPELPAGAAFPQGPPWWAPLWPSLAVWAARRSLEKRTGRTLREWLQQYDRQVRAWLKASLRQLLELYEAQAEVFREQLRRLAGDGAASPSGSEAQELKADIGELRRIETMEAEAPGR
jgi:GTP-binding protein EngB required for normal cell division